MLSDFVTQEQLDELVVPETKWQLDLLLKPERKGRTASFTPGFETLEVCQAEDRRRARALRALPDNISRHIFKLHPALVAELLESGAEQQRAPGCWASAVYVRERRLGILGSLLKFIKENESTEMEFILVTHPEWYFDWRDGSLDLVTRMYDDFRRLLNSVRIWDFPGFFVACVSGVYDIRQNKFQLFYRGIFAGEKRRASRIWDRDEHDTHPFCITGRNVQNLPRQLCQLIPNRIVEAELDGAEIGKSQRMREPYHSIYLMWLTQNSIADRLLLDGVTVKEKQVVVDTLGSGWWLC